MLGWTMLATGFSFAAAFRRFQTGQGGASLAAGLLLPAVAALVIIPVTAVSTQYSGATASLSLPLVGGAMVFGLGMQLANGCGSGTLIAAGDGSRRMWIVLPNFCLGGLLGSLIVPTAERLTTLAPINLADLLGLLPGLAATELLLGLLAIYLLRRGPRPTVADLRAAAVLGLLAATIFLLSGQPWGITMGLTLWAAKFATASGIDLTGTPFWSWDGPRQALAGSLLANASSLTDLGLIAGAATRAAWARGTRTRPWPDARGCLAACAGGLLMGIGARLSYGCNIGAFVAGAASGSLHGFIWFAAVLPGSWLGLRLRPRFGLSPR